MAGLLTLLSGSQPLPEQGSPEPVIWKSKYQGGALDLTVNVALVALGAVLARAPLYVNAPWKPWTPVQQQEPNIAVKFQTAMPAGAYIDPILWPTKWPQPDVLPNVALTPQTARPAGTYIDPQLWKPRLPDPDVLPNIAVNLQTIQLAGEYLDPPLWVTKSAAPDIPPNVAALSPLPSAQIPAPVEPWINKRLPPQIDIAPSFATTETVPVLRSPLYVTAPWKWGTPPEQGPNLAVRLQTATPAGTYIDPVRWPKWVAAPDVLPNIAALIPAQPPIIPAPIDPSFRRTWAQIDVFPNLATAGTESVPALRQPLYINAAWKRWAQVDQAPNVAVSVSIAVYIPPAPIEPQKWPRWIQAPDVLPNAALYAPAEATFVFAIDGAPLSGGKFYVPDLYPNIAVKLQTITPAGAYIDPVRWQPRPYVPDIYPNIAPRVAAAPIPLFQAIDPWIAKRYAPQIEIFPNVALYKPSEAPIMRQVLNEPVIWKVKYQFEQAQNLAVLSPAPSVPSIHQVNMSVSFGVGLSWMGTRK